MGKFYSSSLLIDSIPGPLKYWTFKSFCSPDTTLMLKLGYFLATAMNAYRTPNLFNRNFLHLKSHSDKVGKGACYKSIGKFPSNGLAFVTGINPSGFAPDG